MRRAAGTTRWVIATALAVVALACLLAGAERWLMRGARPGPAPSREAGREWLTLLPPPRVVEPVATTRPRAPAPRRDEQPPEPPWWEWAWRARSGSQAASDLAPAAAAQPDSAPLLLARLGLEPGLLARSRPDSALAARLAWLTLRGGYLPADLRPVLRALGRAEAYRAIAAQAATLYDEFLSQEIITPD